MLHSRSHNVNFSNRDICITAFDCIYTSLLITLCNILDTCVHVIICIDLYNHFLLDYNNLLIVNYTTLSYIYVYVLKLYTNTYNCDTCVHVYIELFVELHDFFCLIFFFFFKYFTTLLLFKIICKWLFIVVWCHYNGFLYICLCNFVHAHTLTYIHFILNGKNHLLRLKKSLITRYMYLFRVPIFATVCSAPLQISINCFLLVNL